MTRSKIWLMALVALGRISWRMSFDSCVSPLVSPDLLYKLSVLSICSHSQKVTAA